MWCFQQSVMVESNEISTHLSSYYHRYHQRFYCDTANCYDWYFDRCFDIASHYYCWRCYYDIGSYCYCYHRYCNIADCSHRHRRCHHYCDIANYYHYHHCHRYYDVANCHHCHCHPYHDIANYHHCYCDIANHPSIRKECIQLGCKFHGKNGLWWKVS